MFFKKKEITSWPAENLKLSQTMWAKEKISNQISESLEIKLIAMDTSEPWNII